MTQTTLYLQLVAGKLAKILTPSLGWEMPIDNDELRLICNGCPVATFNGNGLVHAIDDEFHNYLVDLLAVTNL